MINYIYLAKNWIGSFLHVFKCNPLNRSTLTFIKCCKLKSYIIYVFIILSGLSTTISDNDGFGLLTFNPEMTSQDTECAKNVQTGAQTTPKYSHMCTDMFKKVPCPMLCCNLRDVILICRKKIGCFAWEIAGG